MSDEEAALRAELGRVKADLAAIQAVPEPLSHDEQVALLERGVAELRRAGRNGPPDPRLMRRASAKAASSPGSSWRSGSRTTEG